VFNNKYKIKKNYSFGVKSKLFLKKSLLLIGQGVLAVYGGVKSVIHAVISVGIGGAIDLFNPLTRDDQNDQRRFTFLLAGEVISAADQWLILFLIEKLSKPCKDDEQLH
jgi:hypothetical protein